MQNTAKTYKSGFRELDEAPMHYHHAHLVWYLLMSEWPWIGMYPRNRPESNIGSYTNFCLFELLDFVLMSCRIPLYSMSPNWTPLCALVFTGLGLAFLLNGDDLG